MVGGPSLGRSSGVKWFVFTGRFITVLHTIMLVKNISAKSADHDDLIGPIDRPPRKLSFRR